MSMDIPKESRTQAITSIERYFRETRDEKIGNIAAAELLAFFLEELGPVVYNQAVSDVQERIQARVMEVDIDLHEEPFQYWQRAERKKKSR